MLIKGNHGTLTVLEEIDEVKFKGFVSNPYANLSINWFTVTTSFWSPPNSFTFKIVSGIPTGSGILGTGSSTVGFGVIEKFTTNSFDPTEYYSLIESPNLGAYNYVDDKIRIIETETISGSVLSPYISTQHYPDNRFTLDTYDVEVAISIRIVTGKRTDPDIVSVSIILILSST